VIEIVTDRLNSALQMAWRDLMPLTFNVVSREENMQFAAFVDGGDMVVNCSFMVQLPDAEPARFDILYPFQTLKPISTQLRSRTQSESSEDDASWRERLERAVMSIPLSVRTRLCEPDIALRHLANLKEGDVIPARVTDTVEILVDGRPFFEAVPGELAGKSALSITKRIRG
jgi:flagellar motor switch protein FliM